MVNIDFSDEDLGLRAHPVLLTMVMAHSDGDEESKEDESPDEYVIEGP